MLLAEYGELNQTKLLSYCGLNLAKHKKIIDELSEKGLIEKNENPWGSFAVLKDPQNNVFGIWQNKDNNNNNNQ